MIKFFKSKNVEKEIRDVIKTDKIEGTVPKVVGVVAYLRKALADAVALIASMQAEAAADQKKIDELEAILASLVNEGGESAGGVV